jgi:hypothetical protein
MREHQKNELVRKPEWGEFSPASSGLLSVYAVTSDRVLFQCHSIGREDRSLGREYACRWAPRNSLSPDEFRNWIEIVFGHANPLPSRGIALALV